MAKRKGPGLRTCATQKSKGTNPGFEEKLWQGADKLRSNMDAAEYKHVVLGLIFLKYVSDAFDERRRQLERWTADISSAYFIKEPRARYEVLEDRDEYTAANVFWVPREAISASLYPPHFARQYAKLVHCQSFKRKDRLWQA